MYTFQMCDYMLMWSARFLLFCLYLRYTNKSFKNTNKNIATMTINN